MRVLSDGLSELVAQQALRVALLMVVLADVAVCARSDGKQGISNAAALGDIRITPDYHSSVDRLSEEQQILLKDVLINATLSWFGTVLKVRPEKRALKLERSCDVTHRMVRRERYCVGTCSQTTFCGPVSIPKHHLQPCHSCAGNNCTVSHHKPRGVPDTDLVVYVSAIADQCGSQLVYGSHCQLERETDRPIAAYLNVCPSFLVLTTDFYHLQIATVLHNLVKILAFSKSLFPFFRDEWGNPRNERDREGLPLRKNEHFIIDGTIRYYSHNPWFVADNVTLIVEGMPRPPVHSVKMVTTSNVVREVQDHFNCTDVIGGELESQSPLGDGGLWEKRVFGEELMTASTSYWPVLSRLTLALLHDSGWYLPDYSYGGQLHWGRGMGCGFVKGSCYNWLWSSETNNYNQEGGGGGETSTNILPFCRRSDVGQEGCVDQRRGVGVCIIKTYLARLPEQFQYFSTKRRGGGSPVVDYCPIFQYDLYGGVGRVCMTAPDMPPTFAPEEYGPNSRCFEHEWTESGRVGGGEGVVGGGVGCYTYTCSRDWLLVRVAEEEVVCRHAGQRVSVQYSHNNTTHSGHVVCPKYEELCANYDCPGMCSGQGSCDRGHCRCQPGYYGEDCSRKYTERLLSLILTCDDITCQNGGSCVANDDPHGFTCQCPAGHTGLFCETEHVPDPCHNITCHGNRLCTRTEMGVVGQCECLPDYGGEVCEELLLCEQRGKPCDHGQCERHRKSGEPVCVCEEGYRGARCNRRDPPADPCSSSPCLNGGTCTTTTDEDSGELTYQCSCTPGFKGRMCGNRKNPCKPNPCQNGGTCVRERDSEEWGVFHCVCLTDFTGDLCDTLLN